MSAPLPQVRVGVAVITSEGKVLMFFNSRWGAFSLPMSKQRTWADPTAPGGKRLESYREAAIRAAAEVRGKTLLAFPPGPGLPEHQYQQSDADGELKIYDFEIFRVDAGPAGPPAPGVAAEWLTPLEILDESRVPISKTARHLIRKVFQLPFGGAPPPRPAKGRSR